MKISWSEQRNELAAALAAAQGQMKAAPKSGLAKVRTKSGVEFSYRYSTFDEIWEMVRKPLSDNGLAIIQIPATGENGFYLETTIAHSSGQWVTGVMELPVDSSRMSVIQAMGTAITYARRYMLSAMVGIASDEDTDAQGSEDETQQKKRQPVAKGPAPWRPTKEEFFKRAHETFPGFTDDDFKDELKAGGFTCYSVNKAVDMWEVLMKKFEKPNQYIEEVLPGQDDLPF